MNGLNQRRKILLWIILAGVWAYPLFRIASSLSRATATYAEEASIHALNDVRWNEIIGFGYALLIASTGVAIRLLGTASRQLILPVIIGLVVAVVFNVFPFDGMIIIAPVSNPWMPTFAGLFVGLLCLGTQLFCRFHHQQSTNN